MLKLMILLYLVGLSSLNMNQTTRLDHDEVIAVQTQVNEFTKTISDAKKPEVDVVTLRDEGENGLLGSATIRDVYLEDYMASGVVGLVGPPVRVSYNENLGSVLLTFHYVPEELRGTPERNLIILHEDKDGSYVQVGAETRDEEGDTISVQIEEPGLYLLADCYQWYTVWGVDMSDYAYTVDPLEYKSDWERECDTGSIMEIADREWALQNGPYFHVSTPEQLAGVVYYANAINDMNIEELYLYLDKDIDLAGYEWVPMGWMGPSNISFNGVVDGQGHKISNMTINWPYNNHSAFIGYSTGLTVKDITFENATVTGGVYTGIVGGEIYISKKWSNVHVTGRIINSEGRDRGDVGSLVGRETGIYFEDCTADVVWVKSNGDEETVEYFSPRLRALDTTPVTEDYVLTLEEDGSVSRTEGGEDHYNNLCWHVEVDGVQVLRRLAVNETSFNPMEIIPDYIPKGSTCRIWLVAHTGETYTRVSTILEYPTE